MYLMYVDESGDTGLDGSPTDHFVLTGFVVHEADWLDYLERLVAFRRRMGTAFGLPLRAELHSSHLTIIRAFVNEFDQLAHARCLCVHVDKTTKDPGYDVFERAWSVLIQGFSNALACGDFPRGIGVGEKGAGGPPEEIHAA